MDINLIKSFIEKSDFDENIILNTDINTSLEKSIFNHIDEAINLIKKLDKFIDNQDFSNILKELSKKFLLIKDKKNVSFETKNIENCILKYSNILSLNDEYKTPEENEEVLIAYLLYIIIKKIQRRFLLLSKSRGIRLELINYISKSRDFFHIVYKFIQEKVMVKYVIELVSEKLSSIDMDSNLSLEKARKIIRAGERKAKEMNIAAVFAVVNPEGNLIIEERMDNAILVSIEVAYKKAYTAAALKLNTEDLTALVQPGAMFYGLQSDPKYIVFGGGMLLKVDGKIVGAVGVSGGSAQEDMEIAKACVKAFETI
ncbi:GlcG/HbpS family heme-binding protein [Fusobacterium polymorphum]|uniref:DhaG protein n=1 Tax=Fusobacterium nucleatum subsp. polymorphum TaxID=76857 RepID=A0A2C6BS00_FUSNP|nr:heme-binding protein [Fusobacterium polymorphum]MBS5186473.1 heme-binding protein [Fusobacterium nucleatum]PHI06884.1 DhaG protein [Fusobacterium polymorphum]PHI16480.1 DhaG protein [Fusobacterium polymorphum]